MRIVSIEPLNRRKSRVLTDEGPAFALYNGELEAYGLTLDGELDGETYERILREVLCPRAKERMLHLLEASDRTEAELRRRLREGCFPPEAVEAAIDYGKRRRYVDDRRYAENYVSFRAASRSRRQLEAELAARGISRDLARECLEEIQIDEGEQVRRLLEKRGFDPENADEGEMRRTMAFLSRRGFSYEAILDIMHKKY